MREMREPTKPGKWKVRLERDTWGDLWWAVLLPSGIRHSTWRFWDDAIDTADHVARNGLRGEGL